MRALGFGCGGRSDLPFGVSHGDADLVLAEPGLQQFADGLIGLLAVFEDADDGRMLLGCGHGSSPNINRGLARCHGSVLRLQTPGIDNKRPQTRCRRQPPLLL